MITRGWINSSVLFYGDPPAPSANESTDQTLGALTSHLPALMQAYNKEVGPSTQAQFDASSKISPQYEQLMTELYQKFAPQLAQAGSQIDTQTRNATASTDKNILSDQGADIAKSTDTVDRGVNPEYYKTRALEGNKLGELLNSINLNAPDIEAERQINQENARSGNTASNSATNTVANALNFGDQKLKRTAALSNSIGQATNFLQSSNNPTAVNAATTTLSKQPSQTGTSQFGGVTPSSNEAYSSGNNLLSAISGFQNNSANINANRRDVLDRVNGTLSAL